MPATRYIVVVTTAPDQVPAYLYDGATLLATVKPETPAAGARTILLVFVDCHDRMTHAATLAQGQVDRLVSGLHGAGVFADAASAWAAVDAWVSS